jgi:hypothetical protein
LAEKDVQSGCTGQTGSQGQERDEVEAGSKTSTGSEVKTDTKGQTGSEVKTGVNVIKLFSFVIDDEAQQAKVFSLGNPFQSGLRV